MSDEYDGAERKALTHDNFDKLDALRAFPALRGHTLHELAFAWLLNNKHISSVIAGVTKPEQVTSNVATVGWKLSDEEMDEVKELL